MLPELLVITTVPPIWELRDAIHGASTTTHTASTVAPSASRRPVDGPRTRHANTTARIGARNSASARVSADSPTSRPTTAKRNSVGRSSARYDATTAAVTSST